MAKSDSTPCLPGCQCECAHRNRNHRLGCFGATVSGDLCACLNYSAANHDPGCPNAPKPPEAPKVEEYLRTGDGPDTRYPAKPAPAPEPKWDNTTVCFGSDCPNCEREKAAPEPQGSEEPIEPVTELEAEKSTSKILRAQLVQAISERDEARATKDMHKERQEEARAEVDALRAELSAIKRQAEDATEYVLAVENRELRKEIEGLRIRVGEYEDMTEINKRFSEIEAELASAREEIERLMGIEENALVDLATERAAREREKAHFYEQWTLEEARFLEMLHRAEKAEATVIDLEKAIVDWETEPQYRVTNLNWLHRVAKDIMARAREESK